MDTSDTGDTGTEEQELPPIVSAAELAGEDGGISCSAVPSPIFIVVVAVAFVLSLFRRS